MCLLSLCSCHAVSVWYFLLIYLECDHSPCLTVNVADSLSREYRDVGVECRGGINEGGRDGDLSCLIFRCNSGTSVILFTMYYFSPVCVSGVFMLKHSTDATHTHAQAAAGEYSSMQMKYSKILTFSFCFHNLDLYSCS